jgi:serine/threonine protein kinase/Tfp pilus assembly protein PilF
LETPPPRCDPSRLSVGFAQPAAMTIAVMPRVGDTFEGFHLVEELGHGSFARVYRAKQQALAGRDVALKVTLRATREPERLARLQHTNIVPVYSVHNAAPVQVICMPFLGRQTIADKILGYRQSCYSGRLSTKKVAATRKGSTSLAGSGFSSTSGRPGALVPPSSAPQRPVTSGDVIGDVEAVLEILVQLADGLDHAHQRGILHLDLKPANVLLADSGEPMLLDFNLSFDTTDPTRELVGGTIPYMAPEQLLDLRSRGRGGVDARTDLYSLGVLAYEMLAGTSPFPTSGHSLGDYDRLIEARKKGPPCLRDINPNVSPAVESIVRKLLAPEPADRYQSAADLREDLKRQQTDRPLRFAADRSIPERIGKWRRRNPRTLVAICLAAVLSLAGATGGLAYYQSEGRTSLEAESRAHRARKGLEQIRLDLALDRDLLEERSGSPAVDRGREKALAILCEYGLPGDPDWQNRPAFRRLSPGDRDRVAGDLGELLLLLAHSKWSQARNAEAPVRKLAALESLGLNQIAETCFAGSPPAFLKRQRAEITAFLDAAPLTDLSAGELTTGRNHFLTGVGLISDRNFVAATAQFQAAIEREPGHAAAHFCLALCWHNRRLYDRAVERFETAAALMPDDPRAYNFAGQSYARHGMYREAEATFTRAVVIAPDHPEAYRCRATARFDLGDYINAERDATLAISRGVPEIQIYSLRARIREAKGDFFGAASDRRAAAEFEPQTDLDYITRGWSRLPKHPTEALADFRAALRLNPRSETALRNEIHVLAELLDDNKKALQVATQAVEVFPESATLRAHKAVLHARLGDRTAALREARRLEKDQKNPNILFALGRTYALTSQMDPGDRSKAIALLTRAFLAGHQRSSVYESLRDLEPLRKTLEFEKFLTSIKELQV